MIKKKRKKNNLSNIVIYITKGKKNNSRYFKIIFRNFLEFYFENVFNLFILG